MGANPIAPDHKNTMTTMAKEEDKESLQAALADVEILQSAYPDECHVEDENDDDAATDPQQQRQAFPLTVTLRFSPTASCRLQWIAGYPTRTGVQVASYRARDSAEQAALDRAVAAIRATSAACCDEQQVEGGLACCAAGLQAWEEAMEMMENTHNKDAAERNDDITAMVKTSTTNSGDQDAENKEQSTSTPAHPSSHHYTWISGPPLLDRKSSFQAHLCRITCADEVKPALEQLVASSSKLQRATHHMYAYRLEVVTSSTAAPDNDNEHCRTVVLHDNDDDGEDGAGSRLAHLLEMRQDSGVLVVVSRWFGGIHLGPKRFAHITNVARELLVAQESGDETSQKQPNGSGGGSKK